MPILVYVPLTTPTLLPAQLLKVNKTVNVVPSGHSSPVSDPISTCQAPPPTVVISSVKPVALTITEAPSTFSPEKPSAVPKITFTGLDGGSAETV